LEGGSLAALSLIRSVADSLFGEYRPFRRLSRELPEGLGEVLSIVQEEHPAGPALHEKRDQRRVGLGRVAVPAGEDQVVGPVVRGLTAAGANMVQGDGLGARLGAAIGAHRSMLGQKPIAMRLHGATGRTAERRDGDCGMST
jgi:hypothetical protein